MSIRKEQRMACRLLLFDLDGTLLSSDKTISKVTMQELQKCREQGIMIGISTSRSEKNSMEFIAELNPDVVISSAGALVKYKEEYIYKAEFTKTETKELIQKAREICGEDCEIAVDTVDAHYWNYKIDPKQQDRSWGDSIYTDFQDFMQESLKLCVEIFDESAAEKLKQNLSDYDCARFSDGYWYKFTKKTATKENAILRMCNLCGISTDEITAFGDDYADIGMLKLCGIGVAMGNAIDEVKAVADQVIGDNDNDGIGYYLQNVVLKRNYNDLLYELAAIEDLQTVYDVVQYTIKTIYPNYYPAEVVDFFCEHHSKDAILKDIENGYVSVLKIDRKIIATGCFVENHITRVYVLPEHQKKGYGTFIMKNIEDQIREKYDKAYLDASLPAATLYEKLGFSTIKHERYPVENEVILVYEIMEKELYKTSTDRGVEMAENFEYNRATLKNIEELVRTRIIVLRVANKLAEDVDMSVVEQESYAYYKRTLETGEHIAYLVYDNGTFIGAGGVSFYQVMPTYHNPSGKKAYIMNMYTAPEYRRQGIAFHTLDLLVKDAKKRGVSSIALEATDMGRPLYEKYGFVKMEDEMELKKTI